MMSKDVENFHPVLLSAAGRQRVAENHLLFSVMAGGIELEFGVLLGIVNRPAGERSSNRDDIFLRVAAIHA